jgi:hypothetical protein
MRKRKLRKHAKKYITQRNVTDFLSANIILLPNRTTSFTDRVIVYFFDREKSTMRRPEGPSILNASYEDALTSRFAIARVFVVNVVLIVFIFVIIIVKIIRVVIVVKVRHVHRSFRWLCFRFDAIVL